MLHAECDDGSSADFPPSSLHFITWLPETAGVDPRLALMAGRAMGPDVPGWDSPEDSVYDEAEREGEPF